MSLRPQRLWLHAALFLATVLTTTAAGALYVHPEHVTPIEDGLPFSVPLLVILLCHEFGHYLAARAHGLAVSLPFFIPLPPSIGLFGTLGAVIRMPPAADRRKLMDVGAAGPLAGLVVAIPILSYGLSLSEVRSLTGIGMQEGNSLLYAGLKFAVKGQWLPGGGLDVMLHPTALAGWAGLLVTMLNLMPFGQLDGGHIAVAYFGNRYPALSRRLQPALLLMAAGVFAWVWMVSTRALGTEQAARVVHSAGIDAFSVALMAALPWLIWFGLLKLLQRVSGIEHPPVDERPLGRSRRVLFWIVCLVFVVIFMPIPMRLSIGKIDVQEPVANSDDSAALQLSDERDVPE